MSRSVSVARASASGFGAVGTPHAELFTWLRLVALTWLWGVGAGVLLLGGGADLDAVVEGADDDGGSAFWVIT